MAQRSKEAPRIVLNAGDDFISNDDGLIELLPTGFKRMSEAHAAGSDVVIEIDGIAVLRLSIPITPTDPAPSIVDRRVAATDRRTAPRRKTLKGGQIVWPKGVPVRCIVRNLSPKGANLEVLSAVPGTFDLVLDGDKSRRSCFVVWRKGTRVGVRFQ